MLQKEPTERGKYLPADEWFIDEISLCAVRALTMKQARPEWFIQRMFSLTSSTTDNAIAVCSGNEAWFEHKESWCCILAIISPTGITVEVVEQESIAQGENEEEAIIEAYLLHCQSSCQISLSAIT